VRGERREMPGDHPCGCLSRLRAAGLHGAVVIDTLIGSDPCGSTISFSAAAHATLAPAEIPHALVEGAPSQPLPKDGIADRPRGTRADQLPAFHFRSRDLGRRSRRNAACKGGSVQRLGTPAATSMTLETWMLHSHSPPGRSSTSGADAVSFSREVFAHDTTSSIVDNTRRRIGASAHRLSVPAIAKRNPCSGKANWSRFEP
jgi:hypothetical protein